MRKITQEDIVFMRALRDDGLAIQSIADKFECSTSTVCKYTKSSKDSISIGHLRIVAMNGGKLPEKEINITNCGEIIGRFMPV